MNTINMPGFTAGRSLTKSQKSYQMDPPRGYLAATGLNLYAGTVQPAQSDMYLPHEVPRATPDLSTYHSRPVRCLKWTCLRWDPLRIGHCKDWVRSIGVWNPVAGFCE
jgi:hypothetical protein